MPTGKYKRTPQMYLTRLGNPAWNKGKPWSKEVKDKFRLAKLGKKHLPHTKETKEKIRLSNLGKKRSVETRLKQSNKSKERFMNPENHPLWKGGISRLPYSPDWSEKLREDVRNRDNRLCQNCGMTENEHLIVYNTRLHVHHINHDKANCSITNLITLCAACNIRANFNIDYWESIYRKKLEIYYGVE